MIKVFTKQQKTVVHIFKDTSEKYLQHSLLLIKFLNFILLWSLMSFDSSLLLCFIIVYLMLDLSSAN